MERERTKIWTVSAKFEFRRGLQNFYLKKNKENFTHL